MNFKRLNLFAGHYGSGKTTIALNVAIGMKKDGKKVSIADLDIVNPYFRTKDKEGELEAMGIHLIVSPYANSNVDFPALPSEIYTLMEDRNTYGILDIGGDDRGALALGRYRDEILKEGNYNNFMVVNLSRPLTRTVNALLEVKAEIEKAGGIPFTGIVNNTNVGLETRAIDVVESISKVQEMAKATNLDVVMTTYPEYLDKEVKELCEIRAIKIPGPYPIKLQKLYYNLTTDETGGEDYGKSNL